MPDESVDSAEYRAMNEARREFYQRWASWVSSTPRIDDIAIEARSTVSVIEQLASLMLLNGGAAQ